MDNMAVNDFDNLASDRAFYALKILGSLQDYESKSTKEIDNQLYATEGGKSPRTLNLLTRMEAKGWVRSNLSNERTGKGYQKLWTITDEGKKTIARTKKFYTA